MNPRFFLANRSMVFFLAAVLTLTGLALRLAGARGDLWLDEVWSVWLVGRVHSVGEVFWGINHANNHFLNSLWIYAVGQHASTFTYRLPAVLFGTASVPAAGWVVRRHGRAAALVTMLLFATSFALTEYGSQARGYAGLVFFTLLAIGFAAEAIKAPRLTRPAPWLLGLSLGLGFLSQMVMLETALVLFLWIAVVTWRREGAGRAVAVTTFVMFPGALFIAPFAALLVAESSRFDLGVTLPFALREFWAGYGTLLVLLLGVIPHSLGLVLLTVAGVFAGAIGVMFATWTRESLFGIALVIVPLLFCAAALPNTGHPRFFLPFGVFFLLGLGRVVAVMVEGPGKNAAGMLALLAVIVLNLNLTADFLTYQRGDYSGLIATMAKGGTIRYGTTLSDPVRAMMAYYGDRIGARALETPRAQWCMGRADWLILTEQPTQSSIQLADEIAHRCDYRLRAISFRTYGLSSPSWHIFHVERQER